MTQASFAILTVSIVALCSQFAPSQQSATFHRVGDAFRGPIKIVRSEITGFTRQGNQLIETPPTLVQVINYAPDGLSREIIVYRNGTPRQKTVETYHSNGNRIGTHVLGPEGNPIAASSYEYDNRGFPLSETRYNSDGSVKDTKFIQSTQTGANIAAHSVTAGNGTQIETSVNSRDESRKTSTWSTTKPDGSRSEQISSKDDAGNHITEILSYSPDGVLTGRRISKVDREVTRLEATEYDGHANVLKKTFETRQYDSRKNLIKFVNYRWNAELQKFEPASATYHHITYFQ
jgi:hypothetical protein